MNQAIKEANPPVQPFDFQGKEVRTTFKVNDVWFVVKDVCLALEINQPTRAVANHPEDEVSQAHITDSLGRTQKTLVINEAGLYRLIFRSDKAEAETFRKWVFTEVLPALRKTGRFEIQPQPEVSPLDLLRQMFAVHEAQDRRLELLEGAQVELEHRLDDQPISAHSEKRSHVQRLIQELGNVKGGRAQVGLAYRRFKSQFDLPGTFDALKVSDYSKAVDLLTLWIGEAKRDNGLFN